MIIVIMFSPLVSIQIAISLPIIHVVIAIKFSHLVDLCIIHVPALNINQHSDTFRLSFDDDELVAMILRYLGAIYH